MSGWPAARGETVLAPAVATRLVSRMRRPATEALTAREVEVLELVALERGIIALPRPRT